MTKEHLTPQDISELIDILTDCATIKIEKHVCYWYEHQPTAYTPAIRVQSSKRDLLAFREEYGGSHTIQYNGKQTWVWNLQMIHSYLPTLIPYLEGKTREKAEIVLEATKHCRGKGIEQDKERLKELYEKTQKLQEPRPRKSLMGDSFKFY